MRRLLFLLFLSASPVLAARNWSCGFELQSVTSGVEWDTTTGAPTIETTGNRVRSGAASLKISNTGTAANVIHQPGANAINNVYLNFYIYVTTYPTSPMELVGYADSANFYGARCFMTTTGQLAAWNSTVGVSTSSATVPLGAWTRVGFFYDDVTSNGLKLYIDGVEVTTAAVNDVGGGGRIRVGDVSGRTTQFWIDDLVWNNQLGSNEVGFSTANKIVHLRPNAAGDTRTSISTSPTSTAPFDAVNETTPNDVVDIASMTATGSILDLNLDASSTPGIASGDTINVVQVGARVHTASAANATWIPRIKSQSSGKLVTGSTTTIAVTAWNTHDDTANAKIYKLISYTDPQAGGAWTPALLDTAQIRIATSDASPVVGVSTVWLLVDYTPVAVATRRVIIVN